MTKAASEFSCYRGNAPCGLITKSFVTAVTDAEKRPLYLRCLAQSKRRTDRKTKAGRTDIAPLTNASKMTVSRVLRGAFGFSDSTNSKYLTKAECLPDEPDLFAQVIGSDTASALVGTCFPRLTYGHILDGVNLVLARLENQALIGRRNHSIADEGECLGKLVSW